MPLFRLEVTAEVTSGPAPAPRRLTLDHGAYDAFDVVPDGTVVAVRHAVDAAPAPVRIDDRRREG